MSLDQALIKAKSYTKKKQITEAKKLYEDILIKFPKNIRAHQGLAILNKIITTNLTQNPPQKIISDLVELYQSGNLCDASQQAEELTKKYPNSFDLWNIFGMSSIQIGLFDLAERAYKKSISIKPDYTDAYINLGIALKEQGKFEEAIQVYETCISVKPNIAEVYNNMGCALRDQKNIKKAIQAFRKSISLKPDYAEAYYNIANTYKEIGKNDEAINAFNKCISLKPFYAEAYNNLGITYVSQSKHYMAIETYKKSISLIPNFAESYCNLGNALQHQGRLEEAIDAYKNFIKLKPNYAEVYSYMGGALKDLGKFQEAINACQKCISIKPNYADAYINMGNILKDQGKLNEAINKYNKAISLKPDYAEAHQNLSYALLNNNKLKEGLDEYEWRWKTTKGFLRQRFFSKPLWNKEIELKGKCLLLWSEQGIGDTINWSSCLHLLNSKAHYCILECQEKLIPLFRRSFPNINVKAENRDIDEERNDFDFHLPMGSVYKQCIKEIIRNPKVDQYLIPDSTRVKFWKKRLRTLGNGPYIGISWKSSNMSIGRIPNYAPISEWFPILKIPGITFINLQYNNFKDDLANIQNKLGVKVHNFNDLDHYDDIDDVAALCKALDMVISTKMTVPLISAAVGTPTKLLNWKQSSWNNILENPRSSSVDIFEKNTCEPWNKTISLIAKDIYKL